MVRSLFYAVAYMGFSGCSENVTRDHSAHKLDNDSTLLEKIASVWPKGAFEYQSERGVYTELWDYSDGHLRGSGCFVTDKDTLFSMKMRMHEERGSIKMYYDVMRQNGGKETEFTLSSHSDKRFVFENPFRDFPSLMSYELEGDSAIRVTEYGIKNGEEQKQVFRIRKKP